ncbi:MAG: spore coat protein CotJB [Clostridia bacterium]|nr:spore coat protein CotJB [Clostridia bacterium]
MNRPMNQHNRNADGASLLRKIQEVDFSLYETILYLDVYPTCREALAYYHALLSQRKALLAQYEREIGPVSAFGNASQNSWDWIRSPWPWQT